MRSYIKPLRSEWCVGGRGRLEVRSVCQRCTGAVLPTVPDDSEPGSGSDPDGVVVASDSGSVLQVACLGVGVSEVGGEVGDGVADSVVAGPAKPGQKREGDIGVGRGGRADDDAGEGIAQMGAESLGCGDRVPDPVLASPAGTTHRVGGPGAGHQGPQPGSDGAQGGSLGARGVGQDEGVQPVVRAPSQSVTVAQAHGLVRVDHNHRQAGSQGASTMAPSGPSIPGSLTPWRPSALTSSRRHASVWGTAHR